MSRSKKKSYWTCGYGGKWKKFAKRQANKRVRKLEDNYGNMSYKKVYNSWDICDYIFYTPEDIKATRK